MIVDSLDNMDRYASIHPQLKDAFSFIRKTDLNKLSPGRNEVAGVNLYAVYAEDNARAPAEGMLETHRKYADVQVVLEGVEQMGWKPACACASAAGPYDAAKDLQFFKDKADFFVPVHPGMFAVFFPEDAHQPMTGSGRIRKAVLKVKVV